MHNQKQPCGTSGFPAALIAHALLHSGVEFGGARTSLTIPSNSQVDQAPPDVQAALKRDFSYRRIGVTKEPVSVNVNVDTGSIGESIAQFASQVAVPQKMGAVATMQETYQLLLPSSQLTLRI